MPGLDPGIHVFASYGGCVDGRVKPGHDDERRNDEYERCDGYAM